ncbi:MAG: flagellar hook-length control protein FliK [Candidatus Sericytochromatia bacterium]|nr:flagellar hook-length control protein FliK [Candidatus Sericytochromatia bacterium]
MAQPQVEPIGQATVKTMPVAVPVEPTAVPAPEEVAFADLVSEDDLDVLAEWPDEELFAEETVDLRPDSAAAFLTALGTAINPAIVPNFVAAQADGEFTDGGEVRPTATTSRRLPMAEHMSRVQDNSRITGNAAPAETTHGSDAPMAAPAPPAVSTPAVPNRRQPTQDAPAPAVRVPDPMTGRVSAPPPAARMGAGGLPPVAPPAKTAAPPTPSAATPAVSTPKTPVDSGSPAAQPLVGGRRAVEGRRSVAPGRARPEYDDLPVGFIPKEAVQQAGAAEPEVARPSGVTPPAAGGSNDAGESGDGRRDQQQRSSGSPVATPTQAATPGFVNPMVSEAQAPAVAANAAVSADAGVAERRATGAAALPESDDIGPTTVRSETVTTRLSQPAEAAATAPEAPVFNATASMTSQQLVDAVNDGVPLHFAQFPELVQAIVTTKPFVEKTVDIVLQPEGLGRVRLEVSLVDNGTAIRIAMTTQSAAAKQVMESYLPKIQQIAQSQGYVLKDPEVKVSDRPIRSSEGKGQAGSDSAGSRQNRRRRRNNDDGTV